MFRSINNHAPKSEVEKAKTQLENELVNKGNNLSGAFVGSDEKANHYFISCWVWEISDETSIPSEYIFKSNATGEIYRIPVKIEQESCSVLCSATNTQ